MQIPNSHKAVVEIQKLRDYSLNPNHPVGKHKARVFRAALGVGLKDADSLRNQALEIALAGNVNREPSVFGDKYVIDSILEYRGMSAVVRFCWIVELEPIFLDSSVVTSSEVLRWTTSERTTL